MEHRKLYVSILLLVTVLTILEVIVLVPETQFFSVSAVETSSSVQAYWDKSCQNKVYTLDWGNSVPGQTQNIKFYLRNEGNKSVSLHLLTKNWFPIAVEEEIKLAWDYNGYAIHKNQVKDIELVLSIEPTIKDVTNFSFDIVIDCKECTRSIREVAEENILNAPANTVYFIYTDPLLQKQAEATYDGTSGEIVRNLCANTQNYGFNTTKHWLLQSGEINTTTIHNATIGLFGGQYANEVVNHYETVKELTPISIKTNSHFIWFENRTGAIMGELLLSAMHDPQYGEDMFTVMTFYDADSDNTFFVMYGVGWKGTWASGIYFKEVMSMNLNEYTKGYYVFHWVDGNQADGIPQSHEIHQEGN